MGQRQPVGPEVAKRYQYDSMQACEIAEDQHVLQVRVWPPRKIGGLQPNEASSTQGRCALCGCELTAYLGHGLKPNDPEWLPCIKIVLPDGKQPWEAKAQKVSA